jgi:WD40 repeat protein
MIPTPVHNDLSKETAVTTPAFKLPGHKARLTSLHFSADGKLLASAAEDGTARVWDLGDRMELTAFEAGEPLVAGAVLTPDGRVLVALTAGNPATVLWWDVPGEKALGRAAEAHPAGGQRIAMAPDGAVFATADWDGGVKLWETTAREARASLEGLGAGARWMAFSPDGKYLAASGKYRLALWVAARGKPRSAPQLPSGIEAYGVAFSPDGAWLAVGQDSWELPVQQFDVAGGEARPGFAPAPIDGKAVAFSPDGKTLAVYQGSREKVTLLDAATGEPRAELKGGHSHNDMGLTFSPDGRWLAASALDTILVFDVARALGG